MGKENGTGRNTKESPCSTTETSVKPPRELRIGESSERVFFVMRDQATSELNT
jgi:hypothetical protein